MSTDEELMTACRNGSSEAFTELFGKYRQPVWAFFRRRVATPPRAEELAQEVFVAVLKGARKYEPSAPFRAYLFGIAFRVLGADRRQAAARTFEPIVAEPAANGHSPDTAIWVRQALGRLDETEREIVMLREFEELSYAEIATLLEIPVNTVRSRLFRARMELRRLLAPDGAEGPGQ
jgi:RNA polymerase sigma-70 factor (ECF subfamily)